MERLKGIARAATITVPPTLYVKNKGDAALEAAFEELLAKHGLTAGSGAPEVAKAKAALQVQRDLDGIDASNILEGGRGRRGAAARPAVNYRAMMEDESEEEGEEGSGEESEEGEEGSGDDEFEHAKEEGGAAARGRG